MDRTSVHGWASGLAYHTHLVVVLGTNEGREDGEEEEQKGEVAVRGTKLETGYFTPMEAHAYLPNSPGHQTRALRAAAGHVGSG